MKPKTTTDPISDSRGSKLEPLLHSEHTVKIEKMAVGGAGVARIKFNNKPVVLFIMKTAPEDILKIKITSVEKNYLSGEIVEIIEAGPSRRKAPCIYASDCGGCSWQQIDENAQIRQKENLLKELFLKFIPDKPYELLPTVKSPNSLHYRNRIQLKHLHEKLGYFKSNSHDIVDIDSCLIAETVISDEIKILKKRLRPTEKLQKYELKVNTSEQFESYKIGSHGEGLSFSQVNRLVNSLLVSEVINLIEKMTSVDFVTELYAGAGNFTFQILKNFPQLSAEAVELNHQLTAHAVKTIQSERLQKRLFYFTTDCASFVNRRSLSKKLIFVDPPRAGLEDAVLKKICKTAPENLIYISCHPVSLARDLQLLLQKTDQNYQIQHLQIFDMFPQTDHFETLVWLKRS